MPTITEHVEQNISPDVDKGVRLNHGRGGLNAPVVIAEGINGWHTCLERIIVISACLRNVWINKNWRNVGMKLPVDESFLYILTFHKLCVLELHCPWNWDIGPHWIYFESKPVKILQQRRLMVDHRGAPGRRRWKAGGAPGRTSDHTTAWPPPPKTSLQDADTASPPERDLRTERGTEGDVEEQEVRGASRSHN